LLLLAWLIADVRTPDLAAQVYRADLFGRLGMVVWDARWYGGHDIPGYSLLFPPFGSLLGVRVVGLVSALASTVLFERLAHRWFGGAGSWAAALFAVAAVADVWAGRISFALGVTFALAAAFAAASGRRKTAATLSLLTAAASPVAGALLGLAALTSALARRSWRELAVLAVPAALVILALQGLFGEGGFEPFPLTSFLATAGVAVLFLLALPRGERTLRIGGSLYLAACVTSLAVHSPMGSNIARYGALLAAPLLLAARLRATPAASVPSARRLTGLRGVLGRAWPLALGAICIWVVWGPVRETAAVSASADTTAGYYLPVERFVASLPAPVRIEVPLTRSHWEAALLAPHVSLARGWEKQLDERFDSVLLSRDLDAASYRGWLRAQAVAYVALPDAPLDPSSAREGALIRAGLPYLREVFESPHWRVFYFSEASPLVSGPGRLLSLGSDSFAVRAATAGSLTVRVHWTRYLTVTRGRGCVQAGPGGWTRVRAAAPGALTVAARFSFARALGFSSSCGSSAKSA